MGVHLTQAGILPRTHRARHDKDMEFGAWANLAADCGEGPVGRRREAFE